MAPVPSDIEIARAAKKKPIADIGAALGISPEALVPYGHDKAKIGADFIGSLQGRPDGKLILVTAINPTPAGEGKTTTTVGLGDGLNRIGKKAVICVREPSLGPCFGVKGGAAGGGYAQVVPMEDINLHFTGDFHAITSAHNLLSAMIDNHVYWGNALDIDTRRITWRRVMDMNDRALRQTVTSLGGVSNGFARESGFDITVASEVMAILCLAQDLADLEKRLGDIVIGYRFDRSPVYARDIKADKAMAVLLKDAMQPNLVQTLENNPALVHGGPFANIAHGCNSVIATRTARQLADIVVTEAGFGADLGAEKFMDIKARAADLPPDAVVLVATVRALKMHGGVARADLDVPDTAALQGGTANLLRHVRNIEKFGISPVVAINRFTTDSDEELVWLLEWCAGEGIEAAVADVWGQGGGGPGGDELAAKVLTALDRQVDFTPLYPLDLSVEEKIRTIVREIYGADDVEFSDRARRRLAEIVSNGWSVLPVCMAKTQYSFSDDASLLGAPSGFTVHVRDLIPKTGAGFVVALTGSVMTMPGLPREPAALRMDVDREGNAVGLF